MIYGLIIELRLVAKVTVFLEIEMFDKNFKSDNDKNQAAG
jgi:hypothetical protein